MMSVVAAPNANTPPITDAPVMRPRLRDKLSKPDTTDGGDTQQHQVERTETPAAGWHGECIGRECQGQQKRAHEVKLCVGSLRPQAIRGQVALREPQGQQAQRDIHEEEGWPTPALINTTPSVGPSAVPTADIVPSKPMALQVLALGIISPTKAMVRASMTAAPRSGAPVVTRLRAGGLRGERMRVTRPSSALITTPKQVIERLARIIARA